MTTSQQIDLWRSAPSEHQRLEFKEAKQQFDNRKLYKYCVAIANEGGGQLLLGISDKPPRSVVGTAAFNNPIAMAEKLFEAIGFRVDIEEVAHPDGRVLVFHIPSRPRGTAYHYEGAYVMRSGQMLKPMSEDRLRAIFAEGGPDWLEEPAAQNLDPRDVIEQLDTQSFFTLLEMPYPSSRKAVLDRLIQERLIDETRQGYAIRRIGAVLLARNMAHFQSVTHKMPRIIVYNDTSKLNTRLDEPFEQGYAVGFQSLIQFVMAQIPQNEVVENALRKAVKLVPEIVIRELVANALIHQDFQLSGMAVMIEIYANRIEIGNPGLPVVPVERFIDGYQSRNERMADLMRRCHICEEKSSGIDKVVSAVEAYQLPAPLFHAAFRRTVVTLFGHKTFDEMNREDRMRACYQHCCLRYVCAEKMTNQSLRERFKLGEKKTSAVSQTITATMDAGMIKPEDAGKTSNRYRSYLPIWA